MDGLIENFPPDPTMPGHTFTGWWTQGGRQVTASTIINAFNLGMPSPMPNTITLHARWRLDNPTIRTPEPNQVVPHDDLVVSWTSFAGISYEVELLRQNPAGSPYLPPEEQVFRSTAIGSSFTIGRDQLAFGHSYRVRVHAISGTRRSVSDVEFRVETLDPPKRIAISSGHGLYVAGASGFMDEVTEARAVTDQVARFLRSVGVPVSVFHDNTSTSQNENLNTIINWHNNQERDVDVSIHFNSFYDPLSNGTETLYRTNNDDMRALAQKISGKISQESGLRLRGDQGAVPRNNLRFLNETNIDQAVYPEICFVSNQSDVELYRKHFMGICAAIAEAIGGRPIPRNLINEAPIIRTMSMPNGILQQVYQYPLQVSSDTPVTWSIVPNEGELPSGLFLEPNTGIILGGIIDAGSGSNEHN